MTEIKHDKDILDGIDEDLEDDIASIINGESKKEVEEIEDPPPLMTPKELKEFSKRDIDQTAPKKVKIGRNDKCPCGSGKKYKSCCLGKT